jgi:hypothetical protein
VPVQPIETPGADDYSLGPPVVSSVNGVEPRSTAVGAPLGPSAVGAERPPQDDLDRSLDFGPEG